MENPTARPISEQSPQRITVNVVNWLYFDDCGDTVECYDVTSWSAEELHELRSFLEARGAALLPEMEVEA